MSQLLNENLQQFYGDSFTEELGVTTEEIFRDSQAERILQIPSRYVDTPVGDYLIQNSSNPEGIYRQQALTGDALNDGHNVVLGTGTNSGKSRAFMAEGFHQFLQNPNSRTLVFYPLKNLSTDQHQEWKNMASDFGFKPDMIGKIDGSVPLAERSQILAKSRVLLTTPDIVHAWMMSNLNDFDVANFLKNRQLTIIDEADNFNGAFGTNMLYLLRRMQVHQTALGGNFQNHRYIGASATLPNANVFFEELTGQPCVAITEEDNGAPLRERLIAHHAVDKANEFNAIKSLVANKIQANSDDLGIVFYDSRRAVEEMSSIINEEFGEEVAVPQKAGQTKAEQKRLDELMTSGKARVVIATSSMEAGVNYDFAWGINAGLPASKRGLKQREGRIGRHRPGVFLVVAPVDTFSANKRFGSFSHYIEGVPVETPKLYPTNETLQVANAFCFRDERKRLKDLGKPLDPMAAKSVKWPKGFAKAVEMTGNPSEHLTGEKKLLIPPKKSKPQYFHSLRAVSGETFVLSERAFGGKGHMSIGNCSLQQALTEYPPGAIVWHQGSRRRVYGWDTIKGVNRIIMGQYKGPNKTVHHKMTSGSVSLNTLSVVGNVLYQAKDKPSEGTTPFFGLLRGRITQSVSSFAEIKPNGEAFTYTFYDDHEIPGVLDKIRDAFSDYGPKRRSKMSTTGLLMHLPAFRVSEKMNVGEKTKKELFEMILDEYCDAMRIDRRDVGYAYKKMNVWMSRNERQSDDVIYFHDTTPGSLGLSHGLLLDPNHNIREIIKRVALNIDAEEKPGLLRACRILNKAMNGMERVNPKEVLDSSLPNLKAPDGCVLVMPPETEVLHEQANGSSTRVKIIKPAVVHGTYGYEVEKLDRSTAYVSAGADTWDKQTQTRVAPLGKDSAGPPAVMRHFVAANQVLADRSLPMIAMNKKTGELLKPSGENSNTWTTYTV